MTALERLTVLILIDHYLPGTRTGGPVRTVANLIEVLGNEMDFIVLTRDRDLGDTAPYQFSKSKRWHQVGKAQVRYLHPSELAILQFGHILNEIECHVILLNGIFPEFVLRCLIARKLRLFKSRPIVVAPRGHLEYGAMSIKPFKKRLFLIVSRLARLYSGVWWLCASQSEYRDVLRTLGQLSASRARQIPNPTVQVSDWPTSDAPFTNKTSGHLRLVFLARISTKKNLSFALELLYTVRGNVQFDIYGPIEDLAYWSHCKRIIDQLPSSITVSYKNSLFPEAVPDKLQTYHLFLLPTLGENFGHAILEALCAGCPVLISDRTPWSDVSNDKAGWALPLDQPEQFREVIQHMVDADQQIMDTYRQNALVFANNYLSRSTVVEDMRRLLFDLASMNYL